MQDQPRIVVPKPPQLRAVETFIEGYKPLTPADIKNLKRMSYADFQTDFRKDVVKLMVEASDLGMNLFQYGNMIAPDTIVDQKRSIGARLSQDEGLYSQDSELSAASTVSEYLESPERTAILFHILTGKWERNSIGDRNTIQLPTSSPLHEPPNVTTGGAPPPVQIGTNLNPGELISNTHSVNTNTYSPFQWVYDEDDMKRTKVKPGETIPASTLGESSGNVPMAKWGNRFVLPYEMLTGGQGLRVNKLSAMVGLDAAAESSRQYEELVQTLIDGDGVTAATTVESHTDYGGSGTDFAFVAFLNWLDEAMNTPFQISHVLMPKEGMRSLRTAISTLTGNLAFDQLNEVGLAPNRITNMDQIGNVRYGRVPDNVLAATTHMVGVDARYALEKVNRAGMTIRQQAEQIANQTREVVVSDTYLLARLAAEAVKIINFA